MADNITSKIMRVEVAHATRGGGGPDCVGLGGEVVGVPNTS